MSDLNNYFQGGDAKQKVNDLLDSVFNGSHNKRASRPSRASHTTHESGEGISGGLFSLDDILSGVLNREPKEHEATQRSYRDEQGRHHQESKSHTVRDMPEGEETTTREMHITTSASPETGETVREYLISESSARPCDGHTHRSETKIQITYNRKNLTVQNGQPSGDAPSDASSEGESSESSPS